MRFHFIKITTAFSTIYFLFTGCFLFETTTVSQAEIKKSSTWNEEDQPPTFEVCKDLEDSAQWECFQSEVSQRIQTYFEENPLIAEQAVEEEIMLTLLVNKEGQMILDEISSSNSLKSNIVQLEDILYEAIRTLPEALPAIKTNVGEAVASQFQLPIMIQAVPPAE